MASAAQEGPGEAGEIDERFEYDAPRFYDFDEGSPAGVPPADGWFDTEGPRGLATPPKARSDQDPPPAQGATAGAHEHAQQQQAEAGDAKGAGKGKPGEWRRALASIANTKGQQQGGAAPAAPPRKQAAHKTAPAGGAAGPGGSTGVAGTSRPASATSKQQQQQQQPADAAPSGTATSHAAASRRVAATEPHLPRQPAVTVARSPRLRSSQRAHPSQHKTSEQLELERVQREKEEAAALRRRNAAAVKHVLAPPPPPVAHSSKPLTEPVGVELNTSKRQRLHAMETRSMASPYKSMAEQIAAFEGRMPGKSLLAHGSAGSEAGASTRPPAAAAHHHQHLTVPQSPQFATKKRARPPRFKPREVVEAEEMAAMPKFKARPVNKRIMQNHSGGLGVPQVDSKPPTVPEPFALKTDQRAAEHSGHADQPPAGATFVFAAAGDQGGRVTRSRAARAGKKVAAGSTWTGQLTQPEPFRLATDARGTVKRSAAAEPQLEHGEVRPAKRARPGPFQLATDARGAAEQERLEGMRRQQEEHARAEAEFKALPLNKAALAGAWRPAPQAVAALTVPQDVHLRSDARAARRAHFDAEVAAKREQEAAERAAALVAQEEQEAEEEREHRRRL